MWPCYGDAHDGEYLQDPVPCPDSCMFSGISAGPWRQELPSGDLALPLFKSLPCWAGAFLSPAPTATTIVNAVYKEAELSLNWLLCCLLESQTILIFKCFYYKPSFPLCTHTGPSAGPERGPSPRWSSTPFYYLSPPLRAFGATFSASVSL